MLERGEQIVQIERLRLRPRAFLDRERDRALADIGQGGTPFPVPAIEHQHRIAALEAEHVAQVVDLGSIEAKLAAGREGRLDMEPGCAKIIARHGVTGPGSGW